MALEKILLDLSQIIESANMQEILLRILTQSKSASLTSVVCSIVFANPDKFYKIALILFKTIELFHTDTSRYINDIQVKSLYSIRYGINKISDTLYTNERIKTCEDKHRSLNLESLFLKYQLFGVKGLTEKQNTEFIEKLYKIIDQHKSNTSTSKSYGILLARMDRRNLTPKISEYDDKHYKIEFTPKDISDEDKKQSEEASSQYQKILKYSPLRMWADFLIGAEPQKRIAKQKEYDKDPLLALSETKELVNELKTRQNEIDILDSYIPAFSCSKLLLEDKDKLSKEDKKYCKEIVLATVSQLFTDNYNYQISDGVEASIHAIPTLINEYPEETEDYISKMILVLLDETPIGQYKRVCDYVIESVHKSRLWELNSNVAQAILFGYVKIKPIYKQIVTEKRKEINWKRISNKSILEEFEK